jgi:hypothetical protein
MYCHRLFLFRPTTVFPAFLRGSISLTLLALMPFPSMIYWMFRGRLSKAYGAASAAHGLKSANGQSRTDCLAI